MVTIKNIAEKLGIAVSTVSKGLNGASDISEELRQMIIDTAIEMGYRSKKMKKEEHKKLCIFIENMDYDTPDQFGYEIILGFKKSAIRDNWEISLVPVTPELQMSEKYDTYLLKHGYSGAFLLGFSLDDEWMHQLKKTKMPTVLLDNQISRNVNVAYIGTDNQEGIELVIEHLYKLGHRRIAFLNGSPNSMVTEQRHQAFLESMAHHKLEVTRDLFAFGYYVSDCAKYHVPDFLAAGATAILCGSDLIAQGVIKECRSRGFQVPEDISVVGCDDIPLASKLNPPLTTIRQDREALGTCAYISLISLNRNVAVAKTLLRPKLVKRESTAKCTPYQVSDELLLESRNLNKGKILGRGLL